MNDMGRILYTVAILVYSAAIRFAGLFGGKAKLWTAGRKGIFNKLENAMAGLESGRSPLVWFHVSSLGEFEQGRPVMEGLKQQRPGLRIILTFFSPSGYEIRKDYPVADFVFYLPPDTPGNVARFLDCVRPDAAFFVKYDFWFNYMDGLCRRGIPLYVISALFRPGQYFFRWYGGWARKHLRCVARFFVQDDTSGALLGQAGIHQFQVTGDTRFDRVVAIAAGSEPMPVVGQFSAGLPLLVAGSTWEPDEEILYPLIREMNTHVKFIIAPHDTGAARIRQIRERLGVPSVCYSEAAGRDVSAFPVMIIDSVGLLANIYRYAFAAYIGGGFGGGIHNIQEPVTFGVPVFFGPNHEKFREAVDLVALSGAFCVTDTGSLGRGFLSLLEHPGNHGAAAAVCRKYVTGHAGATGRILESLLADGAF